jgi:1,4-dihydroxy-2-naphthoate octaprenyltransferase
MELKIWIKEFRAPFLIAVILPTILGGIIAATSSLANFNINLFLLTLIGVIFIHIGANVTNDYFDFKSGADQFVTPQEKTPFSGGSGLLKDGAIDPKSTLIVALLFLSAGCLIGMYLVSVLGDKGIIILIIGILGVGAGFFYTAPPFRLVHRGFGELFIGLCFGPLVVFGTYFVQIRAFAWEPIIASIPLGFLIATILYINEFPDYRPDMKAGKLHIVARLGLKRAVFGYYILIIFVYISIIAGVFIGLIGITNSIPVWSLFTLITIPMAIKTMKIAKKQYNAPQALIPALASTIGIFALIGIIMCIAYIPRFFGIPF